MYSRKDYLEIVGNGRDTGMLRSVPYLHCHPDDMGHGCFTKKDQVSKNGFNLTSEAFSVNIFYTGSYR